MRIERLLVKNYRQYKNLDISFKNSKANDLHIVIGKNGMGKTTLLNAINWCLYDEEPHSAESSQKLPLLNINSIDKSNIHDKHEVSVELWVSTHDGLIVTFKRTQLFKIHGEKKLPIPQSNEFKVYRSDENGNTNTIEGYDAERWAETFVPSAIREFFFFDGERLDNYFKDVKSQNVKNQIFILSHIHILESMEKRVEQIFKELRRDAGKLNPEIDKKREQLEFKQEKLKKTGIKIKEIKKQIQLADDLIKDYENKLKDLPDAAKLEKDRQSLKLRRDKITSLKNDKEKERRSYLLDQSRKVLLWPAIKKSLEIIDEKKKNREIPPTIDKGLLERIIEKENCDVCGRHLDPESKNRVEKLLDTVKLSSKVVGLLHSMENPLINSQEKLESFRSKRKEIQKQIKLYNDDLQDISSEISEIDQKLSGYDVKNIKTWHKDRLLLEEQNKDNRISLGSANEQKKNLELEVKQLKDEYTKSLGKENKAIELKNQLEFCEKALKSIKMTKKDIMNETKTKIESETKDIFFDLLWKTETFKDVKIDENYNINLIHSKGYNCLGSVSAAERELLALSFTLALHRISGFDSPILIDTPVARVSDDHRENFANIFLDVSKNKQIILLFTPAEYSEEISDNLEDKINAKYEINLLADESEANIEVLT
jgi:DNA sulfur modification protein DndD